MGSRSVFGGGCSAARWLPTMILLLTPMPSCSQDSANSLATAPASTPAIVAEFGSPFTLAPGQTATFAGTDLDVTLVESHGPPPTCQDCPNRARLVVNIGASSETLAFTLGGMMEPEILNRERKRTVSGYLFTVVKIQEDLLTLLVESQQP